METPSKYSLRWRATSSLPSRAGNTSTNRNSCVLNAGRDMAQSSIRSLHHDMRKTFDRSPVPNSASSRARAAASRSSDGVTPRPYLGQAQHSGHAVVTTGGVPTVDRDRLTGHEGRVARQQEGGRGRDLVRPPEPAERVFLDDAGARDFHAFAEHGLGHRRVDEAGTDG